MKRRRMCCDSLCLSLSVVIGWAGAVGSTLADGRAFEWVEIPLPTNHTLSSVHDVNNAGHILCRLKDESANKYYGAVYRDDTWHILQVTEGHTTYVTDINNNGTVVGYSGSGSSLKARKWSYSSGTYPVGQSLGDETQIWSINDFDELAGYDVANGDPVGWVAGTSWVPLPPLSGQEATAAFGINNGDSQLLPLIVGLSLDQDTNTHPVAWAWDDVEEEFDPIEIDDSAQNTDTPYIINENDWIVGARGSSTYSYILWRPDGQGGWNEVESLGSSTGASPKLIGLNNSNEIVVKKSLFYEDVQQSLDSVSLTTLSGIPTSAGHPIGHYSSTNMGFYAISDNGWIVGKATRYDASQQDLGQALLLLVPFDRDNNGEPDYREIIADPTLDDDTDTGGNWVLDHAELARPGLHAPGPPLTTNLITGVLDVCAVRLIHNHNSLHDVLTCEEACETFCHAINRWGYNEINGNPLTDRQKEIIFTFRVQDPTDEGSDYLPDAATQADILDDLRTFAFRYADFVDYVQLGNEIFSGENGAGGVKVYDYTCGETTYTGWLNDMPGSCLPSACGDVITWMRLQARAIREGSALAGRPIQIISAGTAYEAARLAIEGDPTGELEPQVNAANRAAFAFQCIVDAANADDWIVDVHYHYFDVEEAHDLVAADIDSGGLNGTAWPAPNQICALEYGPVPSNNVAGNWWTTAPQGLTGRQRAERFFDEDSTNNPYSTWNLFVTDWVAQDNQNHPGNLPEDFLEDGFLDLVGRGYRLICYADPNQTGDTYDPRIFDMSAIFPGKVKHQSPGPGLTEEWRMAFEAAAHALVTAIDAGTWEPRPVACEFDCESLGSCQ